MSNKIHEPYNRFKGWMRENGITYLDIAEFLGRNQATICAKVNGDSDFMLSEIRALQQKYGLDNNIFFTSSVT